MRNPVINGSDAIPPGDESSKADVDGQVAWFVIEDTADAVSIEIGNARCLLQAAMGVAHQINRADHTDRFILVQALCHCGNVVFNPVEQQRQALLKAVGL